MRALGKIMLQLFACAFAATPALAQQSDTTSYTLTSTGPREALRELTTDRPDKTESPYTVGAGHIQVELDFVTYARDRSIRGGEDFRVETFSIAPVNLKLGLTGTRACRRNGGGTAPSRVAGSDAPTAIFCKVGHQIGHSGVVGGINERPALAVLTNESGAREIGEMERKR